VSCAPLRLSEATWQDHEQRHRERVARFSEPYLSRRSRGARHPVEDFLFTYYSQKPGQLTRWHPGAGVVLTGPAALERVGWKHYTAADGGVRVDAERFAIERRDAVEFTRLILARTAARPAQFGCFGLHEWAMAYRSAVNGVRHANMDLYKWAYKLTPLLPSEIVMDCFELSWRVRTMDMRASPYDLADWGYTPIAIETAEGKAEYVRLQRGFAEESQALRTRLLGILDAALDT